MLSHKKTALSDAPSRAQRLAKKGDIFYQTVRPYQKMIIYLIRMLKIMYFQLDMHKFVLKLMVIFYFNYLELKDL